MNNSNPDDLTQDQTGKPSPQDEGTPAEHPLRIGRYRIEKILGKGGFGLVYLAHDEQLNRPVAVKVPHARLISRPEDAEAYLAEARTVANLDHPGIVPVHDVGSTPDCPCYVVSKYIPGIDLARKLKQHRLTYRESAQLVKTVADALHYAHKQGLVHRDVKPGNILIGKDGEPYLVDFGLALREENIGKGPSCAGTPAYMSPEQARGEGHRVDGRSDIFSLGVVFYELLAGRQPFRSETTVELLEQVTRYEARPLRQYDEKLPKELERICHKAMAKRASERYSSAHDMAEDLRLFLLEQTVIQCDAPTGEIVSAAAETRVSLGASPSVGSLAASSDSMGGGSADNLPIRIVPKGLRSFDAHDADFFLELLPGPRDREGLPDSLRFWKTHIEETDPDNTFTVGLIYGPSGCGKSSLVKAGLLPRLSGDVVSVYIEATPEETETRLLRGLRKRCPALEDNLSLKDTLAALRRCQGIPLGKKVLIVLDQFEQWLHARKDEENTELVQALRQCDGGRVQCIVMVRDDFWLAVSRFLRELEVRLLEGQNIALADLFDLDHARKVLAAFGWAFGKLPENISEATREQKDFLKQSVAGLAEEGKVICVRLALFAEMMKGKPWTPRTLQEVGGTKGVGVTFLEENFSSSTASPGHRYHQKAAHAVLKALLPESGTNIKGQMKSYEELLEVSGYARRPKDFDDLIRILDSEIRLITPTDPEGVESDGYSASHATASHATAGRKCYQLTHDYLVHSLRDWLTRKQKETRRGRAELLLADRAAVWNSRPENRQLPSLVQWLQIKCLTDRQTWTAPQSKMMAKAGRVHGIRASLVGLLLAGMTFAGVSMRGAVLEQRARTQAQLQEKENATRAEGLVASLLSADISQVPAIVSELKPYREWSDPLLKTRLAAADDGSAEKLVLALALLPVDDSQNDYLVSRLPGVSMEQLPVVCAALQPRGSTVTPALWRMQLDDQHLANERFQVACALATFAPEDERWTRAAPFVAGYLANEVPTLFLGQRLEQLRPAGKQLLPALIGVFHDRIADHARQRVIAATALANYLSDQPQMLAELILEADGLLTFSPLVDALRPHAQQVQSSLMTVMNAPLPALSSIEERDRHLMRQALAAVTLIQLGSGEPVWPLLEFTSDPSLRSHLVRYLSSLQTSTETLTTQLATQKSVSVRRALVQALGGLDETRLLAAEKQRVMDLLSHLYQTDPDSGVHAAALWAIRQWGGAAPRLPVGIPAPGPLLEQRISKLTESAAAAEAALRDYELGWQTRQREWERRKSETPKSVARAAENPDAGWLPLDGSPELADGYAVPGNPMGAYQGPQSPTWGPGVLGQALQLDGQGGCINTGMAFDVDSSDRFSYGCWFCTTQQRPMALLSKMEPPEKDHRGFDILLNQGRVEAHIKHIWPTNVAKVVGSTRVDDGAWHHVLVSYDGSSKAAGLRVFIDGRLADADVVNDSLNGSIRNTVPLMIGSRGWGAHFAGQIDDVRIYKRIVPPGEVRQIYENGVSSLALVAFNDRTDPQQNALHREYCAQDEQLQQLKREVRDAERVLRREKWDALPHWTTNSQGQHLVIVPSPADVGRQSIDYSFAIFAHEVTMEQFWRFRRQHKIETAGAAEPDCPVHLVSWFDAAAYCNWLNEQEGIPPDQWCYEPDPAGNFAEGMNVKPGYLKLTGYRLPTRLEWECSCRAGTTSKYYFGDSHGVLDSYAWHAGNATGHSHSVGTLLPNDLGLFDVHGNVWEWCQDAVGVGEVGIVNSRQNRVLSGGAYSINRGNSAREMTSERPTYRGTNIGFRLVRTLH